MYRKTVLIIMIIFVQILLHAGHTFDIGAVRHLIYILLIFPLHYCITKVQVRRNEIVSGLVNVVAKMESSAYH